MKRSNIDLQIKSARNGHRNQAFQAMGIQLKRFQLSIHHSQSTKNAGTVSRINRIFLF